MKPIFPGRCAVPYVASLAKAVDAFADAGREAAEEELNLLLFRVDQKAEVLRERAPRAISAIGRFVEGGGDHNDPRVTRILQRILPCKLWTQEEINRAVNQTLGRSIQAVAGTP